MLYIGYLMILDGQNIKKKSVSELSIFELLRLENGRTHPNRVKNARRGHSSINVHWSMYRGRGAGRWAESSSGARVLPYKPPACACTAARRDVPEGTRSLPCWPCRAAAAAAVWTGMAKNAQRGSKTCFP